jgi:putative ABC transport system substrate-binding protein
VRRIGRRQFLLGASGAVLATTRAHGQARPRRVAWFGAGRAGVVSPFLDAVRAGLRDLGWQEGRNLALAEYWTSGTLAEAEQLARQMLAGNPELVVVYGRDVIAVHRAKPTMPVVFAFSGDPVDAGFVQSLARPGTNFTGLSFLSLELAGKRIDLLREMVPRLRRLGVLARPEHPGEPRERAVSEDVARRLGLPVTYASIQGASDLDRALQTIAREHCDGMVTFPDGVMLAHSARIAAFASEARIATTSGWAGFAENGFLMTLGPNLGASYRHLASYVDRILRGARPEDLPVELPRTVELVLNLRTARTLGVSIPESVKVRADRVID